MKSLQTNFTEKSYTRTTILASVVSDFLISAASHKPKFNIFGTMQQTRLQNYTRFSEFPLCSRALIMFSFISLKNIQRPEEKTTTEILNEKQNKNR